MLGERTTANSTVPEIPEREINMSDLRGYRPNAMTRRAAVAATATASAALLGVLPVMAAGIRSDESTTVPDDFRVSRNRIRQSVMGWCYNPMPIPELIEHCADVGIEAIDGIDPKFYPAARDRGLKIALVSSHGFATGPVETKHHEVCIQKLKSSIDLAVEFEAPNVITFTGMRVPGMDDSVAEQNCLDCWKQVIDYAEAKNITLVLEHLNSRDSSHPMKGHPGYFGDNIERCVDLVRHMNSTHFRLLFDIYHVQVMHGDIIRRIQQFHSLIGHYHTAGNPGRRELDENQEINYPAVLNAIVATGYRGFVAQEFIPTWNDPVRALRHAAMVSDI